MRKVAILKGWGEERGLRRGGEGFGSGRGVLRCVGSGAGQVVRHSSKLMTPDMQNPGAKQQPNHALMLTVHESGKAHHK